MRPLKLKIKGLRSYREEVEIDFVRDGLVAIVGDTGAGKSSILEAIIYVLYNATTWEQGNASLLRAEGERTMSVMLEFECNQKIYRITRSTSVDNHPASVHVLECITDPSDPNRLRSDKDAEIRTLIRQIIGLDYQGFRSAVLLPQGRFQTLLLAPRAEKTTILKGILRLDQLEKLRDTARHLHKELNQQIHMAEMTRTTLLPDPVGELAQAQAALTAAQSDEAKFSEIRQTLKSLQQTQSSLQAQVAQQQDQLERITAITIEPHPNQEVLATVADIRTQIGACQTAILDCEAEIVMLHDMLSGVEVTELHQRQQNLEALLFLQPQINTTATNLQAAADYLQLQAEQQTQAQAHLHQALQARQAANDARNQAETAEREGLELKAQIAQLQQQKTSTQQELNYTQKRRKEAQKSLQGLQQSLAKAQRELQKHQAALAVAQQQADLHAAEEIRASLQLGEPCPICLQPVAQLPSSPHSHASISLETAIQQERDSLALTLRLQGEYDFVNTQIQDLDTELTNRRQTLHEVNDNLYRIESSLPNLTTLTQRRLHCVEILEACEAAAQRAQTELATTQTQFNQALYEHDLAAATIQRLQTNWQEWLVTVALPPATELPQIQAAQTQVLQAIAAAEQLLADVTNAEQNLQNQKTRLQDLRTAEESQAVIPIQHLRDQLIRLESLIGESGLLTTPLTLENLETCAHQALQLQQNAVAQLKQVIAANQVQISRTELELAQIMHDAEIADEATLDEFFAQARALAINAAQRIRQAEADIPQAQMLDAALLPARIRLEAIVEVDDLLANSKFIEFVVSKKENSLLGVASTILLQMSKHRLGFAEGFQIAEAGSGEPRDPRTLSGGELFLASLALALALVEIAGREGGKMGALFLDEGFASLDATTLDDAIDALELEAQGGKLVAVVSHLKAVAERIDQVLEVKRNESGTSTVHWISAAERDLLSLQDLEASLVQ